MVDQREIQRQGEQVRIARENQMQRILESLPAFEAERQKQKEYNEKLQAEIHDKENELKQARELVNQTFQTAEESKELYEERLLELKHTQEELDLARKQNAEWEKTLREQTKDKRPWSWKRAAWAVVSAAGGLALSFWLRKKAPILNAAAGGSAIGSLCRESKPLKGASLIGSAGGALATHWAHNEDNLVGLATETILAGAGYAVPIFQIGEAVAEGAPEAAKAVKDGYKSTKERLIKEQPKQTLRQRVEKTEQDVADLQTDQDLRNLRDLGEAS